jgi:type IV secretory pathway TrbD component
VFIFKIRLSDGHKNSERGSNKYESIPGFDWLAYNRLTEEGINMAKNDRLKEEIAESRHNDIMALTLGVFGFAGLSAAFAYWMVQGWVAAIELMVIIAIGFALIQIRARRSWQKRKDLIKQLDNTKRNTTPDNSIKEPTPKEIMDEIKESRKDTKRAIAITLAIFGATIAITGLTVREQLQLQSYGLELIILGVATFGVSSLLFFRKIT